MGKSTRDIQSMDIHLGWKQHMGRLDKGSLWLLGWRWQKRIWQEYTTKPSFPVIDHYTYVLCGDGDLMEGVSSEAASLAGHLKFGKLIVLYDSNDITLDGDLNMSFSEDVQGRFESYGWQYLRVEDGNDIEEISKAIEAAKADDARPTLIEVKTVIGYGSPNKSGKSDVQVLHLVLKK